MGQNAYHAFINFDDILNFWARARPDDTALEQEGRTTSYSQLEENTRRIIALMAANGVTKGDRVAWLGKNSDLYCQLYLASARVGVVMVPVGWRLAPPEIAYILKDTGAKIVFTGEDFTETAAKIASELPAIQSSWAKRKRAGQLRPPNQASTSGSVTTSPYCSSIPREPPAIPRV